MLPFLLWQHKIPERQRHTNWTRIDYPHLQFNEFLFDQQTDACPMSGIEHFKRYNY